MVDYKFYSLEELVAIILREIREEGERKINEDVCKVVLGRPVFFSEIKENDKLAEDRLRKAAEIAGFKEVYFQYEPVAAALFYQQTLFENEEKIVLVGDFGGGTSDFTVIKVHGGNLAKNINREKDVLSVGGIYIGGDIFDSNIMWEKLAKHFGRFVKIKAVMGNFWQDMPALVINKIRNWHQIPFLKTPEIEDELRSIRHRADQKQLVRNLQNLIEDNYGYILFKSIEKAKIELSTSDKTSIIFEEYNLKVNEEITRLEFEDEIIADEIQKLSNCVDKAVKDAGISFNTVDIVFLTGGSSNIPVIKKIFEKKFGKDKIRQIDAFTSVAYGLGMSGNMYI